MNLKKKFVLVSKNIIFKKLISFNKICRKAGRNFTGKKTIRGRGFKNKKKKRILDFFRSLWYISAVVLSFEYDPNRNTLISLLLYINGIFAYIISVENLKLFSKIKNGYKIKRKNGNNTLLKKMPLKCKICCLEIFINKGARFLRSSASFGLLLKKKFKLAYVRLKSKKIKKIYYYCTATYGSIMNFNFFLNRHKKAGYSRLKGFKPKVRGVAMNPIDHPFGGGEGKKSKKSYCMSPWGRMLKGKKTRKHFFNEN